MKPKTFDLTFLLALVAIALWGAAALWGAHERIKSPPPAVDCAAQGGDQ